ncbi:MAG: 30S ribosomal protein S14 [Phycisphaerae bacterium SM23_33]|jgi:small subunit ribosomal protein S14|nr:MAG: 30S ribosomal protein S14 [Phycisphaerae bacterium SM23_33]
MATKAQIAKSRKSPRFSTRGRNRCEMCGRPRSVYRKFRICRICLRNLANEGKIPGMRKASW